jgi:type I restriction enzyme S subunit
MLIITGIIYFLSIFYNGEAVLTHSNYLVDNENLFLSTGSAAYVYYYNGKASYSADTYAIKSKIDTKYLYHFLLKKINHITFRYFIGSGLEHLQKDDLRRRLELLSPEKPEEQRKIAEILETIDKVIEKTDAIIEKHRRIKQGLM